MYKRLEAALIAFASLSALLQARRIASRAWLYRQGGVLCSIMAMTNTGCSGLPYLAHLRAACFACLSGQSLHATLAAAAYCSIKRDVEPLRCMRQTTTASQPDSVLTFPSFWVSFAIMGLTVAIAWGG